jgi:hypothetical protein
VRSKETKLPHLSSREEREGNLARKSKPCRGRQVSLKMRADRALERHHRTRRELALTRVNCGSPWVE